MSNRVGRDREAEAARPRGVFPLARTVIATARKPDSYGLVLLLILASMVVDAAVPLGSWKSVVAVLLRGGTLIIAIWTSRSPRRLMRGSLVVVAALILVSIGAAGAGLDPAASVLYNTIEGLLVAAAIVVVARRIGSYRRVTARAMLGALCIYLLLGLLYTSMFQLIDASSPEPFFAQGDADALDFLYFSFVTLTTLGFGDLSPAGDLGRIVAVLEALMGQIYLVTVVALIVGNIGRERRTVAPQSSSDQTGR